MKSIKCGSALLLVILITTALTLYATSVYWVFHYMRLSAIEMVRARKIGCLADGLADYARGLYFSSENDEQNKICKTVSWPLGTSNSEFLGRIEIENCAHPTLHAASIRALLFYKKQRVQTISYIIATDTDSGGYTISDWQRTI